MHVVVQFKSSIIKKICTGSRQTIWNSISKWGKGRGGGVGEYVTYLVHTVERKFFLLLLKWEEVYHANTTLGNYYIIKKNIGDT